VEKLVFRRSMTAGKAAEAHQVCISVLSRLRPALVRYGTNHCSDSSSIGKMKTTPRDALQERVAVAKLHICMKHSLLHKMPLITVRELDAVDVQSNNPLLMAGPALQAAEGGGRD
jgi:hypothetical protein